MSPISKLKINIKQSRFMRHSTLLGHAELDVKDIPASATNGHEMDMRCTIKPADGGEVSRPARPLASSCPAMRLGQGVSAHPCRPFPHLHRRLSAH